MKRIIVTVIAAVMLSGCATPPPKVFRFEGTKECNLAWQRAQLAAASRGQMTANSDVLIQILADNPFGGQPLTSTVVRQNESNGNCTISFVGSGLVNPFYDLNTL